MFVGSYSLLKRNWLIGYRSTEATRCELTSINNWFSGWRIELFFLFFLFCYPHNHRLTWYYWYYNISVCSVFVGSYSLLKINWLTEYQNTYVVFCKLASLKNWFSERKIELFLVTWKRFLAFSVFGEHCLITKDHTLVSL